MRISVFIALLLLTVPAVAQQKTFTLQAENDSWFGDDDEGYTNGTRLLWSWTPKAGTRMERLASMLCRGEDEMTCRRTVAAGIGQTMYTPRNLATTEPTIGDRPYGGWLFGNWMFDAARGSTTDHVELYAGVIGKDAHAEEAQTFVHQHVTPQATDPMGWDHQIGQFAAVLATYERSVRAIHLDSHGIEWFDFTPALGAAAGNVFVNGNATATMRLGYNLPTRLVRPIPEAAPLAMMSERAGAPRWDAHVYVAANAAYVARNLFLDAEADTYRIRREPEVREHRFGASVRIRKVRIAYQHTWRSSEFSTDIGRRIRPADDSTYDLILFSFGEEP